MSAQLNAEGPGLDLGDASGPGLWLWVPSSEQIEILRDGVPLHANAVIGNDDVPLDALLSLVIITHSCCPMYSLTNRHWLFDWLVIGNDDALLDALLSLVIITHSCCPTYSLTKRHWLCDWLVIGNDDVPLFLVSITNNSYPIHFLNDQLWLVLSHYLRDHLIIYNCLTNYPSTSYLPNDFHRMCKRYR